MKRLISLALILLPLNLWALDLWHWPEAAGKNSLFLTAQMPALSFTEGLSFEMPEFAADWLFPFPLPLSFGAFFKTPEPNLKSFGVRLGYHIDTGARNLDLYALYVFDFGFLRNDLLEEYGDETQEKRYYDFRAGVRRLFGKYICLVIETDFHLRGLQIGLSFKAN
ncbi:MAG: hypothetical protein MdMp014T_1173 [Treponematales bacterium]